MKREILPRYDAKVYYTAEKGTPYLKVPGVAVIAKPHVDISTTKGFLRGFDDDLGFGEYLQDPTELESGAQLCKTAGQLCYMSFGGKRTTNKDAAGYFENIIGSGHGSVLEHANYSFLLYGVSRSLTHELVRHRAGVGISQVSQRYVDGSKLRFVERPEYQNDEQLHRQFEARIELAASTYEYMAVDLASKRFGRPLETTHERKQVQQTARSVLPNETEAPLVFTANIRALRHILEMRGSEHAETEIRQLALRLYLCMKEMEPTLFGDYETKAIWDVGYCLSTPNRKV